MTRIAFVTSESMPDLNPREQGTVSLLKSAGIEVVPYVWSRPEHEARAYDAIIIRSPWDYYTRLPEFRAWLERLPDERVFNPKSVLRANLDKRYLRTLETEGVSIVPTLWVDHATESTLRSALDRAWKEWSPAGLVIKPTQSAGAFKTIRVLLGESPDLADYMGLDVMVQPLMTGILEEGEWSLVYLGGEFSHSLLKRPKSGDFRVQYTHGGAELLVPAPQALRDFGAQVLQTFSEPLLYARVDLVRRGDQCHLMELELLEPDLFLDLDPEAPHRFLRALKKMLS